MCRRYWNRHYLKKMLRQFTRFLVVLCILVCSHASYIVCAIETVLQISICCEYESVNEHYYFSPEYGKLYEKKFKLKSNNFENVNAKTGMFGLFSNRAPMGDEKNAEGKFLVFLFAMFVISGILPQREETTRKKSVFIDIYERGIIFLWSVINYIHARYDKKGRLLYSTL